MVTDFQCQDSFYKTLTPEQSEKAFQNEWDFDSPQAIDFDSLVECLRDLKRGYVAVFVTREPSFNGFHAGKGPRYPSTPSPSINDKKRLLLFIPRMF
jgi:uridine kinase